MYLVVFNLKLLNLMDVGKFDYKNRICTELIPNDFWHRNCIFLLLIDNIQNYWYKKHENMYKFELGGFGCLFKNNRFVVNSKSLKFRIGFFRRLACIRGIVS